MAGKFTCPPFVLLDREHSSVDARTLKSKGDVMRTQARPCEKERRQSGNTGSKLRVAAIAGLCAMLCVPIALRAQEKPEKGDQGAGIYFNAEAGAKDVGLPIYPGARPHKDKDDEKPSAKFGLWGSSFAFKLAVLKLESSDSPQKVAAFYKKALAKYGTVLDCGAATSQGADNGEDQSSKKLTCEADKPDPGKMTFKAGTKEKQHVVGIEPNGNGSLFQLVYVESPDSDKKK